MPRNKFYGDFPSTYLIRKKGKKNEYDLHAMLTDPYYRNRILEAVPVGDSYVGIATAGEAIVVALSDRREKPISIFKDGELKGNAPVGRWVLVNDVCSTEESIREAIKKVGSTPYKIFAVVDRRDEFIPRNKKRLPLEAMFVI